MSNKAKVKAHGSDDEEDIEESEIVDDSNQRSTIMSRDSMGMRDSIASKTSNGSQITHDKKDRQLTQYEIEKAELERTPVIPDSEISPAAFIFAATTEEQQQILFEEKSQKVKCPHCDSVSHSIVAYETNLLGYLLAILGILVFGVMSMILMPFLVGLTKQAVHKCAKCLNDVKQASTFGLNSLEDRVVAKKFGNFGIILTRRYMLYIAMVLAAFMGIYMFIMVEEKVHDHRKISDLTWNTFREECGYEAFIKSPRKSYRNFEMHHYGKYVNWDGYVIRVNLNDDDPLSIAYHTTQIMVKMEESDIPEGVGADLGVTLSELNLEKYSSVIEDLHIGDHIRFNATMISLGDRHHLHHLRAFNIEKIDGHMDVQAHAHSGGRYKLQLEHNNTEQSGVKHY